MNDLTELNSPFFLISGHETCERIDQWFDLAAKENPERIALVFDNQHISFGQLAILSARVANYLARNGIGTENLVGLYFERSVELVVSMLGIMRVGAAYVPLDTHSPIERIEAITDDAALSMILVQRELMERIDNIRVTLAPVDSFSIGQMEEQLSTIPDTTGWNNNLAYAIYTSGSTGRPKGVLIDHAALSNRIRWMQETYSLTGRDRVLQKTPYIFDVSVWEFLWPLAYSSTMVLAMPEAHKDPSYLRSLIRDQKVSILHFVPTMLNSFLSQNALMECESVNHIFCSGEALSASTLHTFFKTDHNIQLHNLYGPTEATIDVSYWQCRPNHDDSELPIGKPINNIQLYILDTQLNPTPIGVPGELYIGGIGLARGYLNQPGLTAIRFIPDVFSSIPGARLYKTGDQASWLANGDIRFIGRLDKQIKLRGYRIELGEIESILSAHKDVGEAIVITMGEADRRKIVAYATPGPVTHDADQAPTDKQDENRWLNDLRRHLESKLPGYMVPSVLMRIDSIPLTPTGKVNRNRLPEPGSSIAGNHVEPRTDTERLLCKLWKDILKLERVGVYDDFYRLGGNSILSIQLLSRLNNHAIDILASELLNASTIAELAKVIDGKDHKPSNTYRYQPGDTIYSLPNRQRLFRGTYGHHWNMAGMLLIDKVVPEILTSALFETVNYHSGLQHRFFRSDDGYVRESIAKPDPNTILEIIPVSATTPEERTDTIERTAAQVQRELNITNQLFRFMLFTVDDDEPARFLWIIHHSLADGIGVKVFLEELLQRYLCGLRSIDYVPAPQKTSVTEMAYCLRHYANSEAGRQEINYWRSLDWNDIRYLADMPEGIESNRSLSPEKYGRDFTVTTDLSVQESDYLAQGKFGLEGVGAADIILSSFANVVGSLIESDRVLFDMVTTGREKIFSGIDIANTIGWFADFTPVLVRLSANSTRLERLRELKTQLRAIPHSGHCFNALKYLCEDKRETAFMHDLPEAEFEINCIPAYGTLPSEQPVSDALPWHLVSGAEERVGETHTDELKEQIRPSYIQIHYEAGQFRIMWISRDNIYHKDSVINVMDLWKAEISAVVDELKQCETSHQLVKA